VKIDFISKKSSSVWKSLPSQVIKLSLGTSVGTPMLADQHGNVIPPGGAHRRLPRSHTR
jgi:hypothetical protein